jgi:hypothetical protein
MARKTIGLLGILAAVWAAVGCGGGVADTTCDPECGSGYECVRGACVPLDAGTDVPDGNPDVPVEAGDVPVEAGDVPVEAGDVPADVPETLSCVPGTLRCAGADLETCDAEGTGWEAAECPVGCVETPEPHCGDWDPSNIGRDAVGAGAGRLGPGGTWADGLAYLEINTVTGSIRTSEADLRPEGEGLDAASGISFSVVGQAGEAPPIGVFSLDTLSIPAETTVWVMGDNAFAVAATGGIEIAGTFNCKAYFADGGRTRRPGPGGFGAATGPGRGANGTEGGGYSDGGGGGAAFGGAGGAGGYDTMGGAAGAVYGSEDLVPLWSGSGGGNGADAPGYGGPGGGACQFVSRTSIVVSGGIDAAGHGGGGAGNGGGGGGAGSGGGLLFEAPEVTVSGTIAANGGGGAGARSAYRTGASGERGILSADPAPGGAGEGEGCPGGVGNGGDDPAGADSTRPGTEDDGGGGGGGAGRIRINGLVVETGAAVLSPSIVSGAASTGSLTVH